MQPEISLSVHSPTVLAIRPQKFLGGNLFQDYLAAVRTVGALFVLKDKCHCVSISRILELVAALREAKFIVMPMAEVATAIWVHVDELAKLDARRTSRTLQLESTKLYPFQREGVVFLEANPRCMLIDDMGLGKTIQALTALPKHTRCIVVCPSIMKTVWEKECQRWRPDLLPIVVYGKDKFQLPLANQVVILNYEILPEKLDPKTLRQVDTVIADEAHFLKNNKAQRTQRFRELVRFTERVWLLTGTPLLNKPPELWGIMQAGSLARAAYGSWANFCHMFSGYQARWGWQWGTPLDNAHEGLQRVALRRTKAEVLPQLPAKTYRTIQVKLQPHVKGECENVMHLVQERAQQINCGTAANEWEDIAGMSRCRANLAAAKIPTLLALLDQYEANQTPVVVMSAHLGPAYALSDRPGWRSLTGETSVTERNLIVEGFQEGKLKGIACTIQAGGTGITLHRANHMIFVDQVWTPAANLQAQDRICRIGQDRGCVYTYLVADHELDHLLEETLSTKQLLISRTTEKVHTQESIDTRIARLRQMAGQVRAALE